MALKPGSTVAKWIILNKHLLTKKSGIFVFAEIKSYPPRLEKKLKVILENFFKEVDRLDRT